MLKLLSGWSCVGFGIGAVWGSGFPPFRSSGRSPKIRMVGLVAVRVKLIPTETICFYCWWLQHFVLSRIGGLRRGVGVELAVQNFRYSWFCSGCAFLCRSFLLNFLILLSNNVVVKFLELRLIAVLFCFGCRFG